MLNRGLGRFDIAFLSRGLGNIPTGGIPPISIITVNIETRSFTDNTNLLTYSAIGSQIGLANINKLAFDTISGESKSININPSGFSADTLKPTYPVNTNTITLNTEKNKDGQALTQSTTGNSDRKTSLDIGGNT